MDERWNKQVKMKGGFVCEECGEMDVELLESHHVKQQAYFPQLRDDLSNGACLCLFCHARKSYGWAQIMILSRLLVILIGRLKKDER